MLLIDKGYWQIRNTKNKGRGLFAKKEIPKGIVIGDYVGKILHLSEIDFEEEKKKMFLMYYSDTKGIYPDLKKPGVNLLNHSCSPNCFIYKYKNHTLVFALRNIERGEELTISYLLPPKKFCDPCPHECFCGSANCSGSMHLSEKSYKKWRDFQKKEFGNADNLSSTLTHTLKPLSTYPKRVPENFIAKINKLNLHPYQLGK